MDVFDLRNKLVDDYAGYTKSFIKIKEPRTRQFVDERLAEGDLWPEPLLQLNPTFASGGTIADLVSDGSLHPDAEKIFRIGKNEKDPIGKPLLLHKHQAEAIRMAQSGKSYVLTSGTGSGKSLTYIVPIVNHVLRHGTGKGIQAIVVYPMNALANSQIEELAKFIPRDAPVTYARYTGQEQGDERERIRRTPPDILLTNYMMLELLLTRREDSSLVRAAHNLRFLVFDELHTYRGRQGADVALLIRRCRMALGAPDLIRVGTSATMASGGTTADQKAKVAEVAQILFGTPFDASQVIGESLVRVTPEYDFTDPAQISRLIAAVNQASAPDDYEAFRTHPLSSWIETTFGVSAEPSTGVLVRKKPRPIKGTHGAAHELSAITGVDIDLCFSAIRAFFEKGATLFAPSSSPYPVFAFRLHQFFTRGDTVWTSLESEDTRHLSLSKQVSKPGEPDKPLFPLVFCRRCGEAYARVRVLAREHGQYLQPRDDQREENDDPTTHAYLHLNTTAPWPRTEGRELLERLPITLKLADAPGEERINPDYKHELPRPVHVLPTGELAHDGQGIPATLIAGNLHFCLGEDCGVAYSRNQKSERTKLGTLGVDNRSTATTIMAVRALIELQSDRQLRPEARKLLSFTDNRQDASLQAGHFNDFAQVALLRSALYKALLGAGASGLRHGDLSKFVFEAMSLRFEEYAADPGIKGPARAATQDALRRVIEYFLYRDLKRGWRVTAPNLEECALLRFDYEGLAGMDGLLNDPEVWSKGISIKGSGRDPVHLDPPPALAECPKELLEELLRTLLDVLRKELAVKADTLDRNKQQDLVEQSKPRLDEGSIWYLDDPRELEHAFIAYPRQKKKPRDDHYGFFVSSYGGYGRYLRRRLTSCCSRNTDLRREVIDEIIRYFFHALKTYGIVEQVRGGGGDDPGFQINCAALVWMVGDGVEKPIDRIRLVDEGDATPGVNEYFLACYKRFVDLKVLLEAREHTAQVTSDERRDREERFRTAELPLLFCSPTMELGVDIAQLNLVNLRNVPPTPANYAQRSGRAGRGGQPALVYTYCAGRSPHDQYYFKHPTDMVAGSVVPPRIDLANKDLVLSHLHAIWMEMAKPDLGVTVNTVVDITERDGKLPMPLLPAIRDALANPGFLAASRQRGEALLEDIAHTLGGNRPFHENWVRESLERIQLSFEDACTRWRQLYRSAVQQRELHHRIIGDHSRPDTERAESRRLRAQAESQIRLLTEAEGVYEGDFYSYRYFASEGFLPGYNFPRLPISAFVPSRRRNLRDEYVSRPRFLAISEFGPGALIYHEGARYKVHRVNLDFGPDQTAEKHELVTFTLKRCAQCGYAHEQRGSSLPEVCERCAAPLEPHTLINRMVHLQNVSLRLAKRINCDEEERQRFGYKLVTAYRFPSAGGRAERRDCIVQQGATPLLHMHYGSSTTLYRINLGWLNQVNRSENGFLLDLERGTWATNPLDADDQDTPGKTGQPPVRVVPFVQDTKNALVMRFEPVPEAHVLASLQSAFRQAILRLFQLEPRELAAEAIPSNASKDRREILFYESAEGGAGVLRQLVEDPAVLPRLARLALEICHFNPDTLADNAPQKCGKACYDCLLDYGNQPDHLILNRAVIRDLLASLAGAQSRPSGGAGPRSDRMAELRRLCDSKLEIKFLDLLDRHLLTPPSHAQLLLESSSTRPDFFYADHHAAIYIDGPPHDEPQQIRDDEEITRRLMDAGYAVIRFHHRDDWLQIIQRHPDIFAKPTA
jgi:very-short-patch-repair endonuclease